ncbi:MAG TPA: hypothetical protein VML75_26445 [Kofleriaceae bacterium]|nr:hypothetical protein [Kofleriaceae bacterium]
MSSRTTSGWITALTLSAAACGSAYADRVGEPAAVAVAPQPVAVAAESPYSVDLIDEQGRNLDLFQHRGRFYVLGQVGQRYSIRVKNPTPRRVEAALSVDGLDVIDGKGADYRTKRGYVVPAYGELKVDGFRVSTSQVATFRFSSVSNSYAGRKGVARNVGVIGVAIFEEKAAPEIIVEQRPHYRGGYDKYDSADEAEADYDAPASPSRTTRAPASKPSNGDGRFEGTLGGSAGAPAPPSDIRTTAEHRPAPERCCSNNQPAKTERPGLGTEFGERRYSNVSFTRFERANATVPTALAEFRYNDSQGLAALGIRVAPSPGPHELDLRETATPFPSTGFAAPPR